jgi:ankyrin repeat protein
MGTGASVEYQQGENPVFAAARLGSVEALKYFTSEELNIRDNKGRTPLFHAAQNGCSDACGFLIEKGVDLNIDAFNEAIKGEHLAICKQFVEKNISLEGSLRVALESNALSICKYLLLKDSPILEEGDLNGELTIKEMIQNTGRPDVILLFNKKVMELNDLHDNSVRNFDEEPNVTIRPASRAALTDGEERIVSGKNLVMKKY